MFRRIQNIIKKYFYKKVKLFYPILFFFILACGLIIRIWLLYKISVYPDDINFYNISLLTRFREIIILKYWALDYPQGFFILNRLLIVFINNPFYLKIINLVFYISSSILLYKVSKKLFKDNFISILSLALFAFSKFSISNDIALNPYPLAFTLDLALIYLYLSLIKNYSPKKNTLLGLLIILSTFILYNSFFIFIAIFIHLLILIFKKSHKKNEEYKKILTILSISTIPGIMQILITINGFKNLSPQPNHFIPALIEYLNLWINNYLLFSLYFLFVVVFTIVFLLKNKKTDFFLPVFIILSTLICLIIMEFLRLNISTRLFLTIHLGIILMITSIAGKYYIFKLLTILLILVSLIGNFIYVINIKTNKQTFEIVSKQILVLCEDPKTYFIIDSSNYNFYPLYHYYIPFSKYANNERYSCALGHTSVLDANINQQLINLPHEEDNKIYSYYFINLNMNGSIIDKYINLCKKSSCYVFNKKLGIFTNFYNQYDNRNTIVKYKGSLMIDR